MADKVKRYLIKPYPATVREVGTNDNGEPGERQYVVLDLGQHGHVTLRGLTLSEAREIGAALYRPVVVAVQVMADDVPSTKGKVGP